MLDQTRLATHISYFFFRIAVIVVANSGKLVPAAIIVAQIAHSDIHKVWAIKTAALTTASEARINNPKLAISLVKFNNIHFEVSLILGICLLKTTMAKSNSSIATNISLKVSIAKESLNAHHVVSIFKNASMATHMNRYMKFLIFGTETSIHSSVGVSFFMIKYQLYQTNSSNRTAHSQNVTFWSRSIQNINAVVARRNIPSLYTSFFCIKTGIEIADTPRIIHKLKIFEPIIFQIDIAQFHCNAAVHDTNSSGADVHIAKIVNQINKSDTWKCFAILTQVLIKWSAENTKKNNQASKIIIAATIFYIWLK